jgi:hypothetical protein
VYVAYTRYSVVMTKNIGTVDRSVRIVVSLVLGYASVAGIIPADWKMAALVFAIALFATALVGWCGLYKVFGIRTCPVESTQ